ncbi:nucleotidyltransferase family protein [Paucibacter sp. TC2R-5]|uniref:N-acetylmuramate alpha-1-phosphate uridylyltransferase MurU n=1 Tax=Paucibacter sp. TC2R-5 TaxID=2893555 RepID=UPI0021E43959|nr:nucleotidyltransferase family protein [Paucibacter sp. TC2R-5]MCV2359847.1 nucleotidyltransferase family protein [Paucibacter sp. TC2R-5]
MRAIILAAGRGERMRPLTDITPKPLLCVRGGKPLIEFHIEALAAAGVQDIIVNTAWLSEQFPATLGDGTRFGVRLHFSDESAEPVGALETAGGIARALPLLCAEGDEAFWVVAGDVFLPDFHFPPKAAEQFLQRDLDALLWLTHNSPHHPNGDFGISAEGLGLSDTASQRYTWASVGLFRSRMFKTIQPGAKAALRPYLEDAIRHHKLGAELLSGRWVDVGTVERLNNLQS